MNLSDYIEQHRGAMDRISPRIVCKDGLSLSVQASKYHYCSPRDDFGPWSQVEVGYPSATCESLMPYAESPDSPMESVYGYVPIQIVEKLIEDHGGIA